MATTAARRPSRPSAARRLALQRWADAIRALNAAVGALNAFADALSRIPDDEISLPLTNDLIDTHITLACNLAWQTGQAEGMLSAEAPLAVSHLLGDTYSDQGPNVASIVSRLAESDLAGV